MEGRGVWRGLKSIGNVYALLPISTLHIASLRCLCMQKSVLLEKGDEEGLSESMDMSNLANREVFVFEFGAVVFWGFSRGFISIIVIASHIILG